MASSISIDSSLAFILEVRIFIAPERVPEFFGHFKPIHDVVLAEPECRFFVIGQDMQEPGCISWTEGWAKDVEWFMNVQFKKEYYKAYLEATEPMFVKPREVRIIAPQATMNHFKMPE